MTGWTDSLGDPSGILAVFDGEPPELNQVSVHELTIGRDGPSVTVTFDLPSYPPEPPAKWARSGADTVQVQLRFFGVTELELQGISVDPVVDIVVGGRDPVRVEIRSPDLTLTASAGFADVARISAYQRGDTR